MMNGALMTKLAVFLRAIGGLAVAATLAYASAADALDLNQHGLTGTWVSTNAAEERIQAGTVQGVMFEVYPDALAPGTGFLQGSWLRFFWDPWGYAMNERIARQHLTTIGSSSWAWYTFSGSVPAGAATASFTLYFNNVGYFNAPPPTVAEPTGIVTLTVIDCATATMEFVFNGDRLAQHFTLPLVRLTPNVTCAADGEALRDTDFGYSGNWFDPATSGQGLVVELNPVGRVVFFGWPTYAAKGAAWGRGQHWYAGQASYVPGARTLPVTLYETGVFNALEPAIETIAVGTATLAFSSCETAELTFAFTGGSNAGQSGTISLSRAGPTPADCVP